MAKGSIRRTGYLSNTAMIYVLGKQTGILVHSRMQRKSQIPVNRNLSGHTHESLDSRWAPTVGMHGCGGLEKGDT